MNCVKGKFYLFDDDTKKMIDTYPAIIETQWNANHPGLSKRLIDNFGKGRSLPYTV